jgi:hypothetical protein
MINLPKPAQGSIDPDQLACGWSADGVGRAMGEGFKWPDGTVTHTLRIVTTNANSMMAEIHDPRR